MPNATIRKSALKQPQRDPDQSRRPVTVFAQRCLAGIGRAHRHGQRHQLIYAIAGVIRVVTPQGIWVVPSQRAVWVPAGTEHRVDAARPFDLCTLYVAATHRTGWPSDCQVVAVPELLRELLRCAAAFGDQSPVSVSESRLLEVLLDQITGLNVVGLQLLMPTDRRTMRIAQALQADPSLTTTLAAWGQTVGASARTLERLFKAETGMGFSTWRSQARLMAALEGLGAGLSVTQAAFLVGYDDVSSFITMFKKALGTTPKAYFKP
jgi:AraC-like DNA-binding protein/mannose-6-phosphate isomerase-like protein (cupin superfamily)